MSFKFEWGPNSIGAATAHTLGICVFTLSSPAIAPFDIAAKTGNIALVSAVMLNLIKRAPYHPDTQKRIESVSLSFGALAIYCKLLAAPFPFAVIALSGMALIILGQVLSTPFSQLSSRKVNSLQS
jgi:hypothetical protein